MSSKRITVSVNDYTVEGLKALQEEFRRSMGVDFSLSQVIDYLAKYYFDKELKNDKSE